MLLCIVSSASVTNFFPTVVATLGYSNIISLLLTAPPYVLCVITAMWNAWHADRTGERYFHVTVPLYFAMASFIIAACTTSTGPRYFAMMLMVPGCYTGFVVVLAWISNTLPRPPAKRAAALAAINALSNASSIYASYMYPESAVSTFIPLSYWGGAKKKIGTEIYRCLWCELCNGFRCHHGSNPAEVYAHRPEQEAGSGNASGWYWGPE